MFRSRSTRHVPRINKRSGTTAVLYARVSSRDQEREGFSIPAQLKLLRDYASESSIAIEAEFIDVESAGRAGRSEFGAMIEYLEDHHSCRSILVEKTDRLYRNIKDWVTLDDLGVAVHLVKEGVVISESSVSSEKFVHGIKVLMAKNYIDNLSEETRKGMAEKAREGLWPSRAPLGYLNCVRSEMIRFSSWRQANCASTNPEPVPHSNSANSSTSFAGRTIRPGEGASSRLCTRTRPGRLV